MKGIAGCLIIIAFVTFAFGWFTAFPYNGIRFSVAPLSDGNFVCVGIDEDIYFQGNIVDTDGASITEFSGEHTYSELPYMSVSACSTDGFIYSYLQLDSDEYIIEKRSNSGTIIWSPYKISSGIYTGIISTKYINESFNILYMK
ncbi:hypothetical protein J7L68_03530 [bacterium]|nr:hypothetical protein [bacterium]